MEYQSIVLLSIITFKFSSLELGIIEKCFKKLKMLKQTEEGIETESSPKIVLRAFLKSKHGYK